MEAKGCAKACVWKDSRRHFYWALRARLARGSALAQIADASPSSTSEYRSKLLLSLVSADVSDNRAFAEELETLDLSSAVAQLKRDHVVQQILSMVQQDRKATIDGLIRLMDNLSADEKLTLNAALQNSNRSPGV